MKRGRETKGGLYMHGLCEPCNGLQGRYDTAYGNLCTVLRPFSRTTRGYDPHHRTSTPGTVFQPGAVARSMLVGAHALTPLLRQFHPDLATDLLAQQTSITMPSDLRLLIAIARGTTARIAGATGGYFVIGPYADRRAGTATPTIIFNLAEVYFPPLAWVVTSEPDIALRAGWHDASAWATYAPEDEHVLSALVPSLPQVAHPHHTPLQRDTYIEMFASEDAQVTEIVECYNLPR
ncbi:hypothetical protein [Nocardia brasiliensis]|uniref:hypothetical protein n=1 Tax=Nocardia brasiliensis TaxID=37326 RepID=UPI003D94E932